MRKLFAIFLLIFPAAAADMAAINATVEQIVTDEHKEPHVFRVATMKARVELTRLCNDIHDNPLRTNACEKEAVRVGGKWLELVAVLDFTFHKSSGLALLARIDKAYRLSDEAKKLQEEFLDKYAPY